MNQLSIDSTRFLNTSLLQSLCSQTFYVLKMHANIMNAEKIRNLTDKQGYAVLDFYKKSSEKLRMKQMQPGQTCLIVQTQPRYYAGAIAIGMIIEAQNHTIKLKFQSFLNRRITINELKQVDQTITGTNIQILPLAEESFQKILELSIE